MMPGREVGFVASAAGKKAEGGGEGIGRLVQVRLGHGDLHVVRSNLPSVLAGRVL